MSPGRLDPAALTRRLALLDRTLDHLDTFGQVTEAELAADLTRQWAVLHGLQVAAQTCLDLASQIAVGAGRDVADYAGAIDALGDLGVLPQPFARAFRGLAGFRNVVVHEYLDVDLAVVHRILTAHRADLRAFAEHVRAWSARA